MICRPCPVFWTAKIGELSSAKQNFLKKMYPLFLQIILQLLIPILTIKLLYATVRKQAVPGF
jgi:hypothetical protein